MEVSTFAGRIRVGSETMSVAQALRLSESIRKAAFQILDAVREKGNRPAYKRVPDYDPAMVRRVGRDKVKYSPEQLSAARAVLRQLGII